MNRIKYLSFNALFGVLGAAALVAVPATTEPAELPAVEIHAVLSLTGPAAIQGASVARSLGLAADYVNQHGGIKGRPVKFVIGDDQSSAQVAVQLINELSDTKATLVLGPGFSGTCGAAMALVGKTGPLMWCFSPGIYPPAGSYAFVSGASSEYAALALIRFMNDRGWRRLGVLLANDAGGQAWERALAFAMAQPENKNVQIVATEHMTPTDLSVSGQLTRIKAANPQALLTLATGPAWGTSMHGLSDAGIDLPVGASNANLSIVQLEQYRSFLPRYVYFPGTLPIASNSVGKGPVKDAQLVFNAVFKKAGIRPDLGMTVAWDPAMLIVTALRELGPSASSAQLKDYIEKLHGWVGINGVYDFRDGSQRGLGRGSIVIDRWDSKESTFSAVSRPGGFLKQ